MNHKVSVTPLEQYQIFYKNDNGDTVLKRAKYPQEDTVRFWMWILKIWGCLSYKSIPIMHSLGSRSHAINTQEQMRAAPAIMQPWPL